MTEHEKKEEAVSPVCHFVTRLVQNKVPPPYFLMSLFSCIKIVQSCNVLACWGIYLPSTEQIVPLFSILIHDF